MRALPTASLLVLLARTADAEESELFHEHSITAGIATSVVDEGRSDSFVPFVGFRSAFGISVPYTGYRIRLGPVLDIYDQSDRFEDDKFRGYIVGAALRVDTPLDRCWSLGGRAAVGYGVSHADQNGLTGRALSAGIHARNYSFTMGVDVLHATTDESSTSFVGSAGLTGEHAYIITLVGLSGLALYGAWALTIVL